MSIGVTYTGTNGSTNSFSAEGGASIAEQIRQLQSAPMTNEGYHQLKELRRQKREERKAAHGMGSAIKGIGQSAANFVKKLIGFGSSIEENNGKIQLIGDGVSVNNGDVYSKDKTGAKGWHPITDILELLDKREEGNIIGNAQSDNDDEQTDERSGEENIAFALTAITRIVPVCGREKQAAEGIVDNGFGAKRTAMVYARNVYFTGRGRAFKVGPEYEVASFPISNPPAEIAGNDGSDFVKTNKIQIKNGDLTNCEFKVTDLSSIEMGRSTLEVTVRYV